MNWTATGAIGLALAVILGALGAHGLRARLDAYSMGVYERRRFITSSMPWDCSSSRSCRG